MEALREYEIVVGTYEENLLGFLPMKDATLAASFTDHAHSGAIRCLSAAGKSLTLLLQLTEHLHQTDVLCRKVPGIRCRRRDHEDLKPPETRHPWQPASP